jgi:hypothetical protein
MGLSSTLIFEDDVCSMCSFRQDLQPPWNTINVATLPCWRPCRCLSSRGVALMGCPLRDKVGHPCLPTGHDLGISSQMVRPAQRPGDGWVHEVKFDGYRVQAHMFFFHFSLPLGR